MEIVSENGLRIDRPLLTVTHLMQLLTYITGFGGLLVPLVLWLTNKDRVAGMDEHGKAILNLQLSLILYVIISIPAILLLGLGIITLIGTGILGFVLPYCQCGAPVTGNLSSYFLTIPFISRGH